MANDPRGSIWRKWDLHIHSIYSQESRAKLQIKDIFENAINNELAVISIADHSNVDGLDEVWSVWENDNYKGIPIKNQIDFLPGIEVRTERGKHSVHALVIFPKEHKGAKVDKKYLQSNFLHALDFTEAKIKESGNGDYKIGLFSKCMDFKELSMKAKELGGLIFIHAGTKGDGLETEIAHSIKNANEYELLVSLGVEKEKILKNWVDVCELPNYDEKNITEKDFYLKEFGKPSVVFSDSHELYDKSKFTWIKADPTFEGLKQIVYEPKERVCLGVLPPDRKSPERVIKKIEFDGVDEFPEKIVFNDNLCSIIGSRSSGKSALLAYLAYSIDPDGTKKILKDHGQEGPAANIKWENVNYTIKVEWGSGINQQGKIVYIPQNHLFDLSRKPEEITAMIEPVLFEKYPELKGKFEKARIDMVETFNKRIESSVSAWFLAKDKIKSLNQASENIGDKAAIAKNISDYNDEIKKIKEIYSLDEKEINDYKTLSQAISEKTARLSEVRNELVQIVASLSEKSVDECIDFNIELSFAPSISSLPVSLQKIINTKEKEWENTIKMDLQKMIIDYRTSLKAEEKKNTEEINKIQENNKEFIAKCKQNEQLNDIVRKQDEQKEKISKIGKVEEQIKSEQVLIKSYGNIIEENIKKRKEELDKLTKVVKGLNQDKNEIIFGIEIELEQGKLAELFEKFNKTHVSKYIDNSILDSKTLKIDLIRENSIEFLEAIYSGEQRLVKNQDKQDCMIKTLTYTENMRFIATMEGDTIGGFKQSSMTQGKQALFALTLLLSEKQDTWPLLIDQPEDDLDSRSICDQIIPYLCKQKKVRQIIMVSHNANLVIGSDSEQLIIANQHGNDRKNINNQKFDYLTGALEYTKTRNKNEENILASRGIREHACDILDGGEVAFEKRKNKYSI